VEPGANKEDPLDFALWKGAKEGEPNWPSPWGPGRPGWHIECSAMALRHLGDCIDIHGGGQDLIFPHHENEIAQSESFTGVSPFVRIWMHNGLVQFGDQKMSKSVGNLITIKEALERWNPDALRLFVLSSYYRNPLKFSEDAVNAAERGLQRLRYAVNVTSPVPGVVVTQPVLTAPGPIDVRSYLSRFEEAMDDDFDTPKAIANLFDFASEINRAAAEGHAISEAQKALRTMTDILGLTLREPETAGGSDTAPFIELLIATRADLRKAKQFELADGIRDKLTKLGVTLEDRPEGTRWRLAR
ncbi:MAG: class I tRNA ligase family protein, partial [Chloroflexi bacterium]|nr:class I tRNA ligase family protein [Chloroflexota bacterium]